MGYADFSLDEVLERFHLIQVDHQLFVDIEPQEIGGWLTEVLELGRGSARFSEKSRSELIVAPVLLRVQSLLAPNCSFYSGIALDVDIALGLRGECDYIFARSPQTRILRAPFCVILEAKRDNIEDGLGQCAAQMVAARLFNEAREHPVDFIYGCVTTGDMWQFLRLEGQTLVVDTDRYYLSGVETILGILVFIMKGPVSVLSPVTSAESGS